MKSIVNITVNLLLAGILISQTGCAGLMGAGAAAVGGAGGAAIGKSIGNGDPSAMVIGGAVGAAVSAVALGELQKKSARDLARAFDEGRRYEREVAAQSEWYKATLEPEDPNWIITNGGSPRTSRSVRAQAPATIAGGMRLTDRTELEKVLP